MPAGYMRVKRVGVPWARQYVSVDGRSLAICDREGGTNAPSSGSSASLEGSIVRPLASEAHGFVLVTKGEPPLQISCGSAKEKDQWVKAIKAANGATAALGAAPLSMRPPAAVAPRPGKRELLREAIQRQDAGAVTQLLGDGANPDEALADGTPPLCAAVAQAKGGVEIVRVLTAAGANVGGRDVRSTTPLMKAARLGNAEVLQVLLDSVGAPAKDGQPASGSVLDLLDSKQQSALSLACVSGHAACAELLLGSGASVDRAVADGNTALLLAAAEGHEDVVRILLDIGASTTATDVEEETALMKAAAEGHIGVIGALLEHDPRSIGQHNRDNFTALHYASSVGHIIVVDALLAKGADPRAADGEGRTALVLAAMFGHADVIARLLGAPGGAGGTLEPTQEEERLGLAAAQHEGHDEAAGVLEQAIEVRRVRDAPALAAAAAASVEDAAAEALKAQERVSKKLETSVGAIVSATGAMESRVSRIEILMEKLEKTTAGRQRAEGTERGRTRDSMRTLEDRVEHLESLVAQRSDSRLESRLVRVEQKLTDLSVQMSVSKKRGGNGLQEDELVEKFEWLRAQQEQMLLVMTEAIQRQVLVPGHQSGRDGTAAAVPLAVQKKQKADAATVIQAAARGKASRTQALAEEEAASSIQKHYHTYRQRDFFQNRLSVEEEYAASHIQSVWRTREQRLFFENRESVERGYAAAAIQKTVRGRGGGGGGGGKGGRKTAAARR